MLNEGVDMKTRMDRLGHAHDRTNIIYSHAGDQAQLAASEAVWQTLKTAESNSSKSRLSLKVAGKSSREIEGSL